MWKFIYGYINIIIVARLVEAQELLPGKLLSTLKSELNYEFIFFLQDSIGDCWTNSPVELSTPIIIFSKNQKYQLQYNFNRRLLALVCLDKHQHQTNYTEREDILKTLYRNLENMREAPTIFLVNTVLNITNLFKNSFMNNMLNVLALDIRNPKDIYSYRAFPHFTGLKRRIDQVNVYFEPQLRNMGGHPIATIPDNILPRSVVYRDAMGRRQLSGYLLVFMEHFTKSLNATLKISWKHVEEHLNDSVVSWPLIEFLVKGGRVDIPMVTVSVSFDSPFTTNSFALEISKWQLMLPVEPVVDRALLIFVSGSWMHSLLSLGAMILLALLLHNAHRLEMGKSPSPWCLYLLTDPILRGMISQPFIQRGPLSVRLMFITFLILFTGFLSCNFYYAQLHMIIVDPPTKPPIRSFHDIRNSGLEILLASHDEMSMNKTIGHELMQEYSDIFYIVDSSVFQTMRSQPNTSFAYPVTPTFWPLMQRKFAKSQQASFRLSDDFTFIPFLPICLLLTGNSIYRDVLNRYILNTHCSGLYDLWFRRSYDDLVAIGKLEELPYESSDETIHIKWTDLYYIWIWCICVAIASLTIFAFELAVYHMGNRVRHILNRNYIINKLKIIRNDHK